MSKHSVSSHCPLCPAIVSTHISHCAQQLFQRISPTVVRHLCFQHILPIVSSSCLKVYHPLSRAFVSTHFIHCVQQLFQWILPIVSNSCFSAHSPLCPGNVSTHINHCLEPWFQRILSIVPSNCFERIFIGSRNCLKAHFFIVFSICFNGHCPLCPGIVSTDIARCVQQLFHRILPIVSRKCIVNFVEHSFQCILLTVSRNCLKQNCPFYAGTVSTKIAHCVV